MSLEWEVVVKGGKHKPKSQMTNKEKKLLEENKLSNNKFQLPSNSDEMETDKSQSPSDDKIRSKLKSKNMPAKKESPMIQLLHNITGEDIKKIYSRLVQTFPSQNIVVLHDLAMHINLMLDLNNATVDFNQNEFPCAFMSKSAYSALKNIFTLMSDDNASSFIKSAMINIFTECENEVNSIGLRLLLQVCLKTKPILLLSGRRDFVDLFNMNREHTAKFRALIWCIKQACISVNIACQIWLIYLLPHINQKCNTESVIQFGELIQSYPQDESVNETNLVVTDFVPFMDLVFTHYSPDFSKKTNKKKGLVNFQLNENQIARIQSLYPKIKKLAFLSKSPVSLKDYFASLLVRLTWKPKNEEFNSELLDCMDHCLVVSPEIVNQLYHLHVDYPNQAEIMLSHFQSTKSKAYKISKLSPFRKLKEKMYISTLGAPIGSPNDRIHKITQHSSSNSSSCSTLIKIMIYFIFIIGVIGVVANRQYPEEMNHFMNLAQPHFDYITGKLTPAYVFCHKKVLEAHKIVSPHLETAVKFVSNKSLEFYAFMMPHMTLFGQNCRKWLMFAHAKIEEYAPIVLQLVGEMVEAVKKYLEIAYQKISAYIQSEDFQKFIAVAAEKTKFAIEYSANATTAAWNQARNLLGY